MPTRRRLPSRRATESFELWYGGRRAPFTVSIGRYDDGSPAEVFITGAKAGSETEAIAKDGAVLLSIALQYGVPISVIAGSLARNPDGTAATIIGAAVDYVREKG